MAKSESRKWLPKFPSYRAKFVARDLASPARIRITHQKRLPAFSLSQVNYTHELKMSPSCEQLNNSDPFSSPTTIHENSLLQLLSFSLNGPHHAVPSPLAWMIPAHLVSRVVSQPSSLNTLASLSAIVQSAIDLVDEEDFTVSRANPPPYPPQSMHSTRNGAKKSEDEGDEHGILSQ